MFTRGILKFPVRQYGFERLLSQKFRNFSHGPARNNSMSSHILHLHNTKILQTLTINTRAQSGSSIPSWLSESGSHPPVIDNYLPKEETISDSGTFLGEPSFIPDAPTGFVMQDPEVFQSLNHLGEPTLSSLGLGGYWPSGWIQTALEYLHVDMGIPWWGTIVIATVVIRVSLFPVLAYHRRLSVNYSNHMPTLQRLMLRLREAQISNNSLEVNAIFKEIDSFTKRNNVRPVLTALMPMLQAPVFLSMFFGLKGMAYLPVESLQTGGLLWFQNLTIADPYFLLPLISMTTLLVMIEHGVEMTKASSQQFAGMAYVMRGLPILTFFFILNFPADLTFYWAVSNMISLIQGTILRMPSVKTALKIPNEIVHVVIKPEKKMDFRTGFRAAMENTKLLQAIEEREKLDKARWSKTPKEIHVKGFATQAPPKENKPPQIKAVKKKV